MAGQGLRTWIPGEVITANNIQQYLQDQAVQVYDSESSRTSALTGLVSEGMVSYLTDVNKLQVFNGSTWTDVTPATISANIITSGTLDGARLPVIPDDKLPTIPAEKLPTIPTEKLPNIPLEKLPTITVAKGGTGATTVSNARNNLGVFVQSGQPTAVSTGDLWIF
jgi:hypothetical protein